MTDAVGVDGVRALLTRVDGEVGVRDALLARVVEGFRGVRA